MQTKPHNTIIEYSVSEISQSIKIVVESSFNLVKIRGEISNLKFHQSGHVYLSLKDENAVINGVCFKNIAATLKIRPEEGLEVVAVGKVTTYSGRSNYQIIITSLEVGGIGSLMALFEKRKQEFIGKGYFDSKHKKPIPKFPENLYVVTSETGAVIQDIIHRVEARFPLHLIIAPAKVQGSGAEIEIANRIVQINEIADKDADNLIIIARGGGSIEDLWCFNEEIILKAVFNSNIPIISAIGHETDTTLIDYASDLRAPTPTAAAELATPMKSDLLSLLIDRKERLRLSINKILNDPVLKICSLERSLNHQGSMLNEKYQRVDYIADLLHSSIRLKLNNLKLKSESIVCQIKTPAQILDYYRDKIANILMLINIRSQGLVKASYDKLNYLNPNKQILDNKVSRNKGLVDGMGGKLKKSSFNRLLLETNNVGVVTKLLSSLSYKNVLERGFALIRDKKGGVIKTKAGIKANKEIEIEFFTDKVSVLNINT
jgi:exodeoxyribonuclease VII large subunit